MARSRRTLPEGLEEQMQQLLKQCQNDRETRRVQVILLLARHNWNHDQIAAATGYAPTTVRDIQTAFFRDGETALLRRERPAERNQLLKRSEEKEFLDRFRQSAEAGELVTVADIRRALEEKVGKQVAYATPYNLLERHQWRKINPRPKHPKANRVKREAFKKTADEISNPSTQGEGFWAPPSRDVPR